MPNDLALAFMSSTKRVIPSGWVLPNAWAARFSLDISARWSISPRDNVVPTANREPLPFKVSTSSDVMVIISSSGNMASVTTKPVISLVRDAIGNTAFAFLSKSTSCVCWSSTITALDFSPRESTV